MTGVPEYLSVGPAGLSQCSGCGACAVCALCVFCATSPILLTGWAVSEAAFCLLHVASEQEPG